MKKSKKTKKSVKVKISKRKVILIIIAVVLIALVAYGLYVKDCGMDDACYNKEFSRCNKVKFNLVKGGNLYEYKVLGNYFGKCIINIELLKVAPGSDAELVERFESKSMRCKVPIADISGNSVGSMPNLVDYCSGELKEEVYELIIERMYAYLIENLGVIEQEFEAGLVEGV